MWIDDVVPIMQRCLTVGIVFRLTQELIHFKGLIVDHHEGSLYPKRTAEFFLLEKCQQRNRYLSDEVSLN